jgi:hypothetical protein
VGVADSRSCASRSRGNVGDPFYGAGMSVEDVRAAIIAQVNAELEAMLAANAAVSNTLPARSRRGASGPSVVFTLRLDPDELAALELRARTYGMKPSVLARNLIRSGLTGVHNAGVVEALDRLETAVDNLRALVA